MKGQDDNDNHVDMETDRLTCDPEMDGQMELTTTTVRFKEMSIDVMNATTLYVDWCPAAECSNVHGYKVRYNVKDNSSYNEVFVPHGISNYTISGLKPSTEYVISVNAIDENEVTLQTCGWGSQKTVETEEAGVQQLGVPYKAPYVTAVLGLLLLLVAIIVPVSLLLIRTSDHCT